MQSHGIRHVRPVRPVLFPASDPEWEMSESTRHGRMCELLYQLLRAAVGDEGTVGKDNFVYFDASNARRKCAPDGFVKLGLPQAHFDSFKTWEHGAPELAVEILSPSDTEEKLTLEEKLERFHAIGVREVVAFDVDAPAGSRLRAWDIVHGDLVERIVEDERTPCLTLHRWFVVAPYALEHLPAALRLADDPAGTRIVLEPRERAEAELEGARAATEHERRERARALADKERALAEVERLRAELAKRG